MVKYSPPAPAELFSSTPKPPVPVIMPFSVLLFLQAGLSPWPRGPPRAWWGPALSSFSVAPDPSRHCQLYDLCFLSLSLMELCPCRVYVLGEGCLCGSVCEYGCVCPGSGVCRELGSCLFLPQGQPLLSSLPSHFSCCPQDPAGCLGRKSPWQSDIQPFPFSNEEIQVQG